MKTKDIEPNHEIVFRSSVIALQDAYKKYKKLLNEYMKYTFYDDNGRFCIMSGYEERAKDFEKAKEKWVQLIHDVEHYRRLVE